MKFSHLAISQRLPIRVVRFGVIIVLGGIPAPAHPYKFANDQ
jgi:hypothetical protein